jgi:MYXO-CTERM domain-containing protein
MSVMTRVKISVRSDGATLALALALVAAPTSGCGDERAPEAASTSSRPIQGGTNDTTHLFAVGMLGQTSKGTALCSGALLAPNLVALARHCVAAIPSGGIACPSTQFGALTAASSLTVTTDADVRTNATRYAVSDVILPTGADQTSVCGNDIALLVLAQSIALPAYVTPVLTPPMTDHTVWGTTVTDIGYGLATPTDTAGTTAGIRRIKQDVQLACIPNDKTFTDCFPSMAGAMTAAEFASGNATCEGDSGSNAFEQKSFDAGSWVSFGVLSRGGTVNGTCVGGIYTRFDAWSSLIIDAAQQAAAMGGYPPPPWAGGPDGGGVLPDGGADGSPQREAGASPDAAGGPTRDAGSAPGSDGGRADAGAVGGGGSDGAAAGSTGGASPSDAGAVPPTGTGGGGASGTASGGAGAAGTGSSGAGAAAPGSGGCGCAAGGSRAAKPASWPGALLGLGVAWSAIVRRRRRVVAR